MRSVIRNLYDYPPQEGSVEISSLSQEMKFRHFGKVLYRHAVLGYDVRIYAAPSAFFDVTGARLYWQIREQIFVINEQFGHIWSKDIRVSK